MATDCIPQVTFEFQGLRQPVVARFDQAHASSDGGAVLLKAIDERLGLTQRLAAGLTDRRQAGKVEHELLELVRQRVFGIACGYADCNDAARLGHDPVHKLLLDRDPLAGPALASQPTLSRFENAVGRQDLYLASLALADSGHRAPSRAPQGPGPPDHDRPRSDRRPHPRAAGVHLLQRALRHLVLPAAGGDADVQRRADAVPGRRRAAAGQQPRQARGARPAGAAVSAAARGVSAASSSASGSMGALPAPRCWTSSRARRSSTWWPWPAMPAWSSASAG